MKKTLTALIALLFVGVAAANAQSEKQIKAPPPPPPPPKVEITKPVPPISITKGFIKKNPSVANIEWSSAGKIIIQLRDGKTENYNLEDENEKKEFIDKYGLPPTPPPPPPPPPAPPKPQKIS